MFPQFLLSVFSAPRFHPKIPRCIQDLFGYDSFSDFLFVLITLRGFSRASQAFYNVCACLVAQLSFLCDPFIARLLHLWDFPGKNTAVCCHFLLQGILLTQGLNACLLHWQVNSLPLSHQRNSGILQNALQSRLVWCPFFMISYGHGFCGGISQR